VAGAPAGIEESWLVKSSPILKTADLPHRNNEDNLQGRQMLKE